MPLKFKWNLLRTTEIQMKFRCVPLKSKWQFAAYHWNALGICCVQLKSKWNRCVPGNRGTNPHKERPIPGNLENTSEGVPHPRKSVYNSQDASNARKSRQNLTTRSAPSPEIWNKTSHQAIHPWKSGENLTRIDPSPEIWNKTSLEAPRSRKFGTKIHKISFCFLLVGCWLVIVGSDGLCRGPLHWQFGNLKRVTMRHSLRA